jgi:hypothetical protein
LPFAVEVLETETSAARWRQSGPEEAIRRLKATHPNLRSYRVLIFIETLQPTVLMEYHWSKLAQADVTTGAGALVGDFHHG